MLRAGLFLTGRNYLHQQTLDLYCLAEVDLRLGQVSSFIISKEIQTISERRPARSGFVGLIVLASYSPRQHHSPN